MAATIPNGDRELALELSRKLQELADLHARQNQRIHDLRAGAPVAEPAEPKAPLRSFAIAAISGAVTTLLLLWILGAL